MIVCKSYIKELYLCFLGLNSTKDTLGCDIYFDRPQGLQTHQSDEYSPLRLSWHHLRLRVMKCELRRDGVVHTYSIHYSALKYSARCRYLHV